VTPPLRQFGVNERYDARSVDGMRWVINNNVCCFEEDILWENRLGT
jgi:hypothetical protein